MAQTQHTESSTMPHLDPEFYAGQVFWLALSFILLMILASKIILPRVAKVLDNRENHLVGNLSQAEALSEKAAVSDDKYKTLLHNAAEEGRQILKKSSDKSAKKLEEKRAKLAAELDEQTRKAEKRIAEINNESAKIVEQVTAEISGPIADKILQAPKKITKAA